jgi:hypothetical protein
MDAASYSYSLMQKDLETSASPFLSKQVSSVSVLSSVSSSGLLPCEVLQ